MAITTKQINISSSTLSKINNSGNELNLLETTPLLDFLQLNSSFVTTSDYIIQMNKVAHFLYRLCFLLAFPYSVSLILHVTTGISTTKQHRRIPYYNENNKCFVSQRRLRKCIITYVTKTICLLYITHHCKYLHSLVFFLTRGDFNISIFCMPFRRLCSCVI